MKSSITGSSDVIISSMHFMKSGELLVEADQIDQVSEEELSTLILTQEFILYSLERDDWLLQF